MLEEPIVFYNHRFIPESQAFIPIKDRGFLFGDGIFTTLKVCDGQIECFPLHHLRLQKQAESLNIILPEIKRTWIEELIQHNEANKGIWRLKITITAGERASLNALRCPHGQFLMTLHPYQPKEESVRLTLFPYPLSRPTASLKTLAYLDQLWVKDYAQRKGFQEALMMDGNGFILETSTCNIFWEYEHRLFFPDFSLPLLEGIAIQMVIKTAERLQLPHYQVKSKIEDIPQKAHLFLCNSLKGILPIISIDERHFQRNLPWEKNFQGSHTKLIQEYS